MWWTGWLGVLSFRLCGLLGRGRMVATQYYGGVMLLLG